MSNRNAIFSLCEASREGQFKPDVTSFFCWMMPIRKFQESSAPPLEFQNVEKRNPQILVGYSRDRINLCKNLQSHS